MASLSFSTIAHAIPEIPIGIPPNFPFFLFLRFLFFFLFCCASSSSSPSRAFFFWKKKRTDKKKANYQRDSRYEEDVPHPEQAFVQEEDTEGGERDAEGAQAYAYFLRRSPKAANIDMAGGIHRWRRQDPGDRQGDGRKDTKSARTSGNKFCETPTSKFMRVADVPQAPSSTEI